MSKAYEKLKKIAAGSALLGAAFFAAANDNALETTEQIKPETETILIEVRDSLNLPDLTAHPLAGMDVEVEISVKDALGQEGSSQKVIVTLPQREFKNALSMSLQKMRRTLALDSRTAPDVADSFEQLIQDIEKKLLDTEELKRLKAIHEALKASEDEGDQEETKRLGILIHEKENIINPDTLDRFKVLLGDLKSAESAEDLEKIVGDMWTLMLQLEEDLLSEAEKNLRDIDEALKEAIENGDSEEKIEELKEKLQKAIEDLLKERKEQAKDIGDKDTQKDYEDMLKQIEEMRKKIEEMKKLDPEAAQKMKEMMQGQMGEMKDMLQEGKKSQQEMQEAMKGSLQEMLKKMEEMKQLKEMQEDIQKLIKEQKDLMGETDKVKEKKQDQMSETQKQLEDFAQKIGEKVERKISEEKELSEKLNDQIAGQGQKPSDDLLQEAEQSKKNQERLDEMKGNVGDVKKHLDDLRKDQQELDEDGARKVIEKLEKVQKELQDLEKEDPLQGQQQSTQNMKDQLEEMSEKMQELQDSQQQIQEQIESMKDKLKEMGKRSPNLQEAGKKTKKAARKLGQGEAGEAVPMQQEALDALSKAGQELEQMMKGGGAGNGLKSGVLGEEDNGDLDPLGRNNNNGGLGVDPSGEENTTRVIRDEIRERLESNDLPQEEREYLERLLNGHKERKRAVVPSPR